MAMDRIKDSLAKFIDFVTNRADYFALYEAKVVKQSGNKVDVQFNKTSLGTASDIPIRLGIPGVEVTFIPGQTILVGWESGDPRFPYALAFQGGETVTELKFTGTQIKVEGTTVVLANGSLPVARQTDSVTGTAGPYPLSGGTITGGNPNVKA